jgi:hypothetical protein
LSIIQAAGWPIWPLVICSIVALALIIERFVSLKSTKVAPPKLLDEAIGVSRQSLPSADVINQLHANSALGEVLASGMRTMNMNPRCSEDDLRNAMEGAGRLVAHRLERYLPAIATRRCGWQWCQPCAAGPGHLYCVVQHGVWFDCGHPRADFLALLSGEGGRVFAHP